MAAGGVLDGGGRVTTPAAPLWRIIEGDCRDVLRTLPVASVDLAVADPPYGETALEWDRCVDGWLPAVMRVLKPRGSLWCFGSLRFFMERAAEFAGWKLAQDVVWEKHNGSGFDADRFKRVHELAAHFYPADATWSSIYRAPQRVPGEARPASHAVRARASVDHRRAIGAHGYEYTDERLMRSVIRVRSCHGRAVHPTQKPEGILEPLIRYSCPPGGLVLDPFAGSGSTGLAAQRAGMRFLGVEIAPTFADLARRRLSGDVVGDAPLLAGVGGPP